VQTAVRRSNARPSYPPSHSRRWPLTQGLSAAAVVLLTSCAQPTDISTCERGNESCPCFGNGTCNGELTCLSNFCVNTDLDAGADVSSTYATPPSPVDASSVSDASVSGTLPEATSSASDASESTSPVLSSEIEPTADQTGSIVLSSTVPAVESSTAATATASAVPSSNPSESPTVAPSASPSSPPSASAVASASATLDVDSGAPCIETGSFPFVETFECGSDFWTPTGGTWAVVAGDTSVYQQSAQSNVEVFALPFEFTPQTDVRVEARIRVVQLSTSDPFARAGIYLRLQALDEYVGAVWNAEHRLALRTATSGGGSSEGANGNQPLLTLGEWYHIGVAASGDRIEVLRDGQIVGSTTSNEVVSGQIALAARNAVVQFDDVTVGPY
jgi:Domain of Unknown Function (DUF1080)